MAGRIFLSRALRKRVEEGRLRRDGRTRFSKKAKRMIALAERYESDRAASIEKSGLDDHVTRVYLTGARIRDRSR